MRVCECACVWVCVLLYVVATMFCFAVSTFFEQSASVRVWGMRAVDRWMCAWYCACVWLFVWVCVREGVCGQASLFVLSLNVSPY